MNCIRQATIEDLARIAEIEIFNYRLNFYPIFKSDWFYFEELNVPKKMMDYQDCVHQFYVYDDGVVKGFMQVREQELVKLFVEPILQNQKIGSGLLNYAISKLNTTTLWALEKNTKAIDFYMRHGFKLSENRKLEEGTSEYLVQLVIKKYYEAYEERYKTIHKQGASWLSQTPTPIVVDMINKYQISKNMRILEVGCGEGRDANKILASGYSLLATDISSEAITYCKERMPNFGDSFKVVDCLSEKIDEYFDFIYSVAVIHMLVLDEDRKKYYQFISHHLKENGYALICSMGDGVKEFQSDISTAFELQERNSEVGKILVAGTSCRMVSFETLKKEIEENDLVIIEKGMTSSLPDFNELMFVVVKKK